MSTIVAQICIRRDTAANFTSANPTLALGEIAYETDTRNIKVGDGATAWTALPYINPYRGGTAAAPTSNTVLGSGAGAVLESGATDNVLLGATAGDSITTGDQCVVIGSGADVAAATNVNSIVIGNGAVGNGSNTTTIGNSSTTGTFIPAGDLILSGSTQQILVGTATAPANDITLQVSRDADAKIKVVAPISGGTANAALWLDGSTQGSWAIQSGSSSAAGLRFYDFNNTEAERIRFTTDGNITIHNGNLNVASGKGIDFSDNPHAGGMTSELLNDYEEGTWTPVITAVTPPTTPFTMQVEAARYTKVGRLVTVQCYIATNSPDTAGASGNVQITGLPFTCAGSSNFAVGSVGYTQSWGDDYPSGLLVSPGSTLMLLEYRDAADGTTQYVQASDLFNGAGTYKNQIMLTATYTV